MASMSFEPVGIGDLIRRARHVVPPNQRSYAWEEKNVLDLLQDLQGEMGKDPNKGSQEYFLGTIVLVDKGDGSPPQISDGQQRLATTNIIIARIRDILRSLNRNLQADEINREYISSVDIETPELTTQICLNVEDNAFFTNTILQSFPHYVPDQGFLRSSNKRLLRASETAYRFLVDMLKSYRLDSQPEQLIRWIKFIQKKTSVVVVTVSDENNAFRLFETLNDRGVRAGQVDILKNFFLQKASARLSEIHTAWNELASNIESSMPDEDEQLILYLRHLWITKNGHTTERELSTRIRDKIINETLAADFVSEANLASVDYVALSSPTHIKWKSYKSSTREHLTTISGHLRVEQIKPLLFAIARFFDPIEADKTLRFAVSLSVRFLIFGGKRRVFGQALCRTST